MNRAKFISLTSFFMSDEIQVTLKENGFEVQDFVDSGAFGLIFKVRWHQYPDKLFVAKVMIINDKQTNDKAAAFNAEISALQLLAHPNVIYVFKHFKVGMYYYIILEYCSYGSFTHLINTHGVLNADEFCDAARQCLSALNECHQNGIVHLDIKPDNILISDHQRVKLADFGLAYFVNQEELVKLGKGSLSYCAPERFLSKPFDPKKADIWSLGLTFYFFVVGRHPWNFQTKEEAQHCISSADITFPLGIKPEIINIIELMLTRDPQIRPSANNLLQMDYFKESPVKRFDRKSNSFRAKFNSFTACGTSLLGSHKKPLEIKRYKSGGIMPHAISSSQYSFFHMLHS